MKCCEYFCKFLFMAMSHESHSTATLKDNVCAEDDISNRSDDYQSRRGDKIDCTDNDER